MVKKVKKSEIWNVTNLVTETTWLVDAYGRGGPVILARCEADPLHYKVTRDSTSKPLAPLGKTGKDEE